MTESFKTLFAKPTNSDYTLNAFTDEFVNLTKTPNRFDPIIKLNASKQLREELLKPLTALMAAQAKINEKYSVEYFVEKSEGNHRTFHVLNEPNHQIFVDFNYGTNSTISQIFVHIVPLDRERIISLICRDAGIPVEVVKAKEQEYRNSIWAKAKPSTKNIGMAYLYVRNTDKIMYHTHLDGIHLHDSMNFLVPVNGRTFVQVATPPGIPTQFQSEELTDMMAINNKKYHRGVSNTEDTFMFYLEPRLSYDEFIDLTGKQC